MMENTRAGQGNLTGFLRPDPGVRRILYMQRGFSDLASALKKAFRQANHPQKTTVGLPYTL